MSRSHLPAFGLDRRWQVLGDKTEVIRGRGRGGHPQRIVAVHLVGHHVVGLQQSLEGARTVRNMDGAWQKTRRRAPEPEEGKRVMNVY
ncbi:hypothetical protein EYF80_019451 [Liparis tanakae]|uniref:Uncharacterized protein n=1 Tax=Liparis tanakae TaxID=230148 RepID=A0A4Z2HX19_9TELE|nr:hypothetical protein EYF80_019451 [Liparis tanakae]